MIAKMVDNNRKCIFDLKFPRKPLRGNFKSKTSHL